MPTFSALVRNEIKPLLDRNIPFDTQLLLRTFHCTARDIAKVHELCRDRFLVGDVDRLVNKADAQACANQFPDGACYVVPGMGHGQSNYGHCLLTMYAISLQHSWAIGETDILLSLREANPFSLVD